MESSRIRTGSCRRVDWPRFHGRAAAVRCVDGGHDAVAAWCWGAVLLALLLLMPPLAWSGPEIPAPSVLPKAMIGHQFAIESSTTAVAEPGHLTVGGMRCNMDNPANQEFCQNAKRLELRLRRRVADGNLLGGAGGGVKASLDGGMAWAWNALSGAVGGQQQQQPAAAEEAAPSGIDYKRKLGYRSGRVEMRMGMARHYSEENGTAFEVNVVPHLSLRHFGSVGARVDARVERKGMIGDQPVRYGIKTEANSEGEYRGLGELRFNF